MKKLSLYIASCLVMFTLITSGYAKMPENLTCAKRAVLNYYNSGEYEKDVERIVQEAEKYFQKRVAENNSSIERHKLAIVLDIDDTSLSNLEGNKKRDFANNRAAINGTFIDADAPAIQPVLRLYNKAISNRIDVFFITFRGDEFRSYTIQNLQKAGYYGWKELYLPSKKEKRSGAVAYKTKVRKAIVDQGYDIILNLGDQESDLTGGYAEHAYKLPNPLYTSSPCDAHTLC